MYPGKSEQLLLNYLAKVSAGTKKTPVPAGTKKTPGPFIDFQHVITEYC